MPELELKRLRFQKRPTIGSWCSRPTGVTPNLLCRLGFCLSLEEPGVPSEDRYPEDSDHEINRYTLLGEYDALFVALLRQRLVRDSIEAAGSLDGQFRARTPRCHSLGTE